MKQLVFAVCVILVLSAGLPALAQDTDDLRREIEALKKGQQKILRQLQEIQKQLKSKPADEQWRTILVWTQQMRRYRVPAKSFKGQPLSEREKQIGRFFENKLTDEQRDRLFRMPVDMMKQELDFYFKRHHPRGPVIRHPGRPHHGRHPGKGTSSRGHYGVPASGGSQVQR